MRKNMRDLIAVFMEQSGADAVVVSCSTHRRHRTKTYIGTFGNVLTCKGLACELYDELHDEPENEESHDDDSGTE